MNELFFHQPYWDCIRPLARSWIDRFTNVMPNYILHHMCNVSSTLCIRSLHYFLTSKRSCGLNNVSYPPVNLACIRKNILKDIMRKEHLIFRSRCNELVQVLFLTTSIHYCEPRSKAIIDTTILRSSGPRVLSVQL